MSTTYFLIANRSSARIWKSHPPFKDFQEVEEIVHPEGRLRNRDINADRHGTSFESAGSGQHNYSASVEPTEVVARNFAASLINKVSGAYQRGEFSDLVLVAEPNFLGLLRNELKAPLKTALKPAISKDFGNHPPLEIKKSLEKYTAGPVNPE